MDSIDSLLKIYSYIRPVIDIGILTFLLYKAYDVIVRTNAVHILRSAIIVGVAYVVVIIFDLTTLRWIFTMITPVLVVSFAIVFQPEVRKIFIKMGQGEWFAFGSRSRHTPVSEVLVAADILSNLPKPRGMLVVFPRYTKLDNIMDTGVKINAELTKELLVTIFKFDTPLHDGACFVRDGKLLAAGCFLPLSEQFDIKKSYGTRHRAALGVSEVSDAVVLVVSEETGAISLAYEGKLHYDLTMDQLTRILEKELDITQKDAKIKDVIDERKTIS